MTLSLRNLVAPCAALLVCLVSLPVLRAAETAPGDPDSPVKQQLEKAVDAVVEAAKTSIAAAKTDQQAVAKAQQTFDALKAIGQLGDFSTDAQADKLMDDLRASGRPAVIDAIIQVQMTNKLRVWPTLDEKERTQLVNSFVEHVKKSDVTMEQLMLLQQLSRMLDYSNNGKLAAETINALLPHIKESKNDAIKKAANSLEGIARRLDLVGKPIEMEGKLLDGSAFDWNSYRGKVVLIDFHASWCGPCRAEVPNVLKAYKGYHDKGFEVVGVNMDTDTKLAEKYQEDTGAKFPTLYSDDAEAKGWKNPLAVKYGVNAIPCVILVDKEGNVVSTRARGPELGKLLEKLLGPPAAGAETEADKSSNNEKKPAALTPERQAALRAVLAERMKKAQDAKK